MDASLHFHHGKAVAVLKAIALVLDDGCHLIGRVSSRIADILMDVEFISRNSDWSHHLHYLRFNHLLAPVNDFLNLEALDLHNNIPRWDFEPNPFLRYALFSVEIIAEVTNWRFNRLGFSMSLKGRRIERWWREGREVATMGFQKGVAPSVA